MKKTTKPGIFPQQEETLTTLIQQLKDTITELNVTIAQLRKDNENLREQNSYLTRQLFAPKSEKGNYRADDNQLRIDPDTGGFSFGFVPPEKDREMITVKEHKRKRKPKASHDELMDKLPEVERTIQLSDEERVCGVCGEKLVPIGREFVRDEIEVIPKKAVRVKIYREVYNCPECIKEIDQANIVKAEAPAPLIEHSYATASLVVAVVYAKYVMGIPLYRQEKDWAELGVMLNRTTLSNWVITCAVRYVLPLIDRMHELLMKRDIVYADETVIQVLHEEGRRATQKSYMWLICSGKEDNLPRIVIYSYRPTRAGENAKELLEGFEGHYLVCDGYQGYNKVSGVVRCSCLAHIRRKFNDAIPKENGKQITGSIGMKGRNYCDTLFMWEREFAKLSPEKRQEKRLAHEKPVLEDFWKWLDEQKPTSGSRLAKAVTYAKNQKEFMEHYLLDGRIEISNQIAENAVRPFAVGRRNWLFSNSVNGAIASAAFYSLIETAKINGLRIRPYLTEVLTVMRDYANGSERIDIDELLPWSETMQSKFSAATKQNLKGITYEDLKDLQ